MYNGLSMLLQATIVSFNRKYHTPPFTSWQVAVYAWILREQHDSESWNYCPQTPPPSQSCHTSISACCLTKVMLRMLSSRSHSCKMSITQVLLYYYTVFCHIPPSKTYVSATALKHKSNFPPEYQWETSHGNNNFSALLCFKTTHGP